MNKIYQKYISCNELTLNNELSTIYEKSKRFRILTLLYVKIHKIKLCIKLTQSDIENIDVLKNCHSIYLENCNNIKNIEINKIDKINYISVYNCNNINIKIDKWLYYISLRYCYNVKIISSQDIYKMSIYNCNKIVNIEKIKLIYMIQISKFRIRDISILNVNYKINFVGRIHITDISNIKIKILTLFGGLTKNIYGCHLIKRLKKIIQTDNYQDKINNQIYKLNKYKKTINKDYIINEITTGISF